MEWRVPQDGWLNFFLEVLHKANTVSHWFLTFQGSNYCYQMRPKLWVHGESPGRPKGNDTLMVYDIVAQSLLFYEEEARGAVKALMLFLTDLHIGPSPICVTYFDEAQELGIQFCILLHLLSHQPLAMEMWYVFMGTRSSISYFSPSPQHCESPIFFLPCVLISHQGIIVLSLRLGNELQKLLLPYIALDFNQNVLKG